ncbi:MAG: hypothetical protein RLZ47_542 [Bacteroidota bacterium]|jgi:hypothetical protein
MKKGFPQRNPFLNKSEALYLLNSIGSVDQGINLLIT